ncbi:hypothetical protein QE152_g23793 [Popillia japonica]|uniref:Uncharacterized protein n=1 Tax=Popillia japonica TaxID=7064 RepID=A0AAW1KGD3_POPJA
MSRSSAMYSKNTHVYVCSKQNLPSTNAVKGTHNIFSPILNPVHWKIAVVLKQERELKKVKMEQYIAGLNPVHWKIAVVLKQERELKKVKMEQYIAGYLPPQKKILRHFQNDTNNNI